MNVSALTINEINISVMSCVLISVTNNSNINYFRKIMGKKEKNKKKGKGAEKTADKTEKKIKIKLKKAIGEDDIESVVKAIEEEERKRQEVKEVSLGEVGPSHRSNVSFVVHPENPELILFGGEFYNGQKTELNNDLLQYDIKRKTWKQVKSPAGPASRCAHQGK